MESARQVIEALGISATLLARRADDAHLPQMEAALSGLAEADASFVLTGKPAPFSGSGKA